MELLYLIDRVLTEVLQRFARFMKRYLRIGPVFLSVIIFLLLIFNLPFFLDIPDPGLISIPVVIVLMWGRQYLEPFVAEQLLMLQNFFDPDWKYRMPLYERNHLAWSSLLIGFSYTLTGYQLDMEELILAFVFDGCVVIAHGVWHFFVREKIDPGKDKEGVSEELQKLINRCKSWLSLPKLNGV